MGELGFYLVTPFQTNFGGTVLVNRGWLPKSKFDFVHLQDRHFRMLQASPAVAQILRNNKQEEFVEGVIRESETKGNIILGLLKFTMATGGNLPPSITSNIVPAKSNIGSFGSHLKDDEPFITMDAKRIAEYRGLPLKNPIIIEKTNRANFKHIDSGEAESLVGQPVIKDVLERYKSFYVTPQTHVVYSFTWFSLSAWVLGTYFYMKRKKFIR